MFELVHMVTSMEDFALYPPLLRGEDTLAGRRRGWGVNILEDARHRIGLLQL
jgi:hypothetical protein